MEKPKQPTDSHAYGRTNGPPYQFSHLQSDHQLVMTRTNTPLQATTKKMRQERHRYDMAQFTAFVNAWTMCEKQRVKSEKHKNKNVCGLRDIQVSFSFMECAHMILSPRMRVCMRSCIYCQRSLQCNMSDRRSAFIFRWIFRGFFFLLFCFHFFFFVFLLFF